MDPATVERAHRRPTLLSRIVVLAAALSVAQSGCLLSETGPVQSSIDDPEFSRLIHQLSEDGGYFWSNNFISNETSYLHVMSELDEMSLDDGVYLGVGPNQNFTYIAAIRPRLAFIVDIRRQNMLEHLLFKVLISRSTSREDYLSRLVARKPEAALSPDAPIADIVEHLERMPASAELFEAELSAVEQTLQALPGLELSEQDVQDVRSVYREFYRQGFNIKYDSWRSFFFPSLKEFMLETDSNGEQRNWLAREETFAVIRDMHRENRIIPFVGDFAGDEAFRKLGRYLDSRNETVTAFYVSNVEFYLFRQRKWQTFVDNVERLPTNDSTVFIRAYANLHRPHPRMVDDHITVSLVQNLHSFLRHARAGRYRNLWDVVTADEL